MAGVHGRVALVTGAGSPGGIGFAIAAALVAGGAKVCVRPEGEKGDSVGIPTGLIF